jgi:Mrp family chromosome partitioning ATPase
MAQPAPNGWRPDLSLLPEGRRALCKDLYPQAVDACAVVAIIGGTRRDDGKSRLAAELSLALAESGHPRVLLLEGDLSRPMVQRFLRVEMPEGQGLSEQLKSRIDERSSRPWLVVECSPTLHVLCEGKSASPELILSRPFEACLNELRSYYDFILIDGPPVSDAPACRAVRDVIDSAILVRAEKEGTELGEATSLFPDRRISVVSVPSASTAE